MVIQLWRGEIGLLLTFWLFGVCGAVLFGLPLFAAMMALTDVPDNNTASIFISALGLFLVYLIWVFVGIWRAANTYTGNPAWANLAKLAVAAETFKILLLIGAVLFADVS